MRKVINIPDLRERGRRKARELKQSGSGEGEEVATRPVIRITPELHEVTDAAIAALEHDPDLYQRDATLVHVVRPAEPDCMAAPGTPLIRPVPQAQLAERMTRVARFERLDRRADEWVSTTPRAQHVEAVRQRGTWPKVRPLAGIIEAPALRPDGTVIQQPGYDAATGYLYDPQESFPRVPRAPSRDQCNGALCDLAEVWSEMSWKGGSDSAGAYTPVAAVLSLLARPAIDGPVPAFVVDKSTRGSGGTLGCSCVGAIATGRPPAMLSWPPSAPELEKVLGGLALRGAGVALFDNVEGVFGSAPLDKVLTASDRVSLRVLGRSEVPELLWRCIIMANGNGVQIAGDTTRRVLLARIEPEVERPEERTGWRHDPLLSWVRQQRARLVCAGLMVLRGYLAAGMPDQDLRPWGSFEAWSRLVPSAIRWAGGPDLMECRVAGDAGADTEATALRILLAGIERLWPEGTTVRDILSTLYTREQLRGEGPPDGHDDIRDAIETLVPTPEGRKPNSRSLGHQLKRARGRIVDGRRLERFSARSGVAGWRVDHV